MDNNMYYKLLAEENITGQISEDDIELLWHHNLLAYAYPYLVNTTYYDAEMAIEIRMKSQLNFLKDLNDLYQIIEAFNAKQIEYRVIKGFVVAATYPRPYSRVMGDNDILIKKQTFNQAKEILEELGYSCDLDIHTYKDVTFLKDQCLPIELHYGLLNPDRESNAQSLFDSMWVGQVDLAIEDMNFSAPLPKEHFRYLVFHMLKHMKSGGIGLRYLVDLKNFSEANNIDVVGEYDYFDKLGYGKLYRGFISLCVYKLNMELKDKECLISIDDPDLELLGTAMIVNGLFGTTDDESKVNHHLSRYMTDGERTYNGHLIMSALFPKAQQLSSRFSYAKQRNWLLPAAWIHRLLRIIFIKELRENAGIMIRLKDDSTMRDRIKLMKAFELTDSEDEHDLPID